ncbi:MAG TPA: IS1182 family transposase [Chloroflexia bacterium]|nr:IS1182 family transposase [Chloroflexia bacterium]
MAATSPPPRPADAPLRLRRPNRDQVTPVPAYLDALLPDDHLARLLWAAVERLDLAAFAAGLIVVEGGPGRAAADPQLLVALWRYATTQGVTSARALARLCVEHVAYLWLCGGVAVNYHSLSDFRVRHEAALDGLMTQVLGRLHHGGLIAFEQVAQDGVRVRASAGAASFHRQATLERSLAEAEALLAAVRAAAGPPDDDPPPGARARAARERAARERVARVEAALAALPAAQAAKPAGKRAQARVSETDAEARVMKMADGGFRPAYNIQLAADTAHQVIVGVAVSTSGSDTAQAPEMVAQVRRRLDRLPADWLMDGGFAGLAAIERASAEGVRVLAPVPAPKDPARDPHRPLPADSAVLAAWRVRMGTEDAKMTYRLRAATIECVNAQARSQYGLLLLRVRGRAKVRGVALWLALAHNLRLWVHHQPAVAPPARAA